MTIFAADDMTVIRPPHRLLRVLVFAVILTAILIGVGVWRISASSQDFGKGLFAGLTQVIAESGGIAAAQAANVARSQGVSLGSLTMAPVQRHASNHVWLVGTSDATNGSEVSMSATDDHVTTATPPDSGSCAYGLAVGSASDAIVAADDLSGSGVYYNSVIPATSCAANLAPTSGWMKVSTNLLHDVGVPPPTLG